MKTVYKSAQTVGLNKQVIVRQRVIWVGNGGKDIIGY